MAKVSPPPHVELNARDMPFWRGLVAERPADQWSKHQLDLAAILARAMTDLDAEQRQVSLEGMVIARASGARTINPRSGGVARLLALVLSLRRTLGLTKRVTKD